MRPFRDLPIGHKLITLSVASSTLALVVCTGVFLTWTFVSLRTSIRTDLSLQADILADNTAAALAFNDPASADETVAALKASSNVDLACVYDLAGQLFASYLAQVPRLVCPARQPESGSALGGDVDFMRQVVFRERTYGTLYLRGNFGQVRERLAAQALAALGAIGVGVIAAILLSLRTQRVISEPIAELSSTAARISHAGDYSLRAVRRTDDEIGELVETFNGMVEEVARRDEQLRAASRLKDEFLAALSHELRTPLNAVLGWVQVLRATPYDPALASRAYASIERNARAQTTLIEDLLDISRIVSGKLQFKLETVDLVAVIEAALEVVRPAAEAKKIAIERLLPASPQIIIGDPNRLQQIAWNILSNAVKFTGAGGHIQVNLEPNADDIVLRVRDDGIGVAAEFLPHVFDRFRQADGSMTRPHGGLGLGLAIARELTELHGGRIVAESPGVGLGATLTVTLPRSATRPIAVTSSVPADDGRLDGLRLLVVDDDEDTRELARVVLVGAGATVMGAANAADALNLIRTGTVDVLLCDLAMPGIDGYELMETVRSGESNGARIPALAVSAHAGSVIEDRVRRAGFDAYVSKPYNFESLFLAIRGVVGKS
jgi:signal transduction histidine kinase